MGAINWYLKDLVTVPLICWLSSAVLSLQQKEISHLHSRNLLEITTTDNISRTASRLVKFLHLKTEN